MRKVLFLLPLAFSFGVLLLGCNKSTSPPAAVNSVSTPVSSADPIQKKLQELAGNGATNCGVLKSQVQADLDNASKCAMDSSKAKNPFYVEYQLPGMNVAVAGNAQGKLYSVQSQESAEPVSGDCPAELRVAPSGRVTCYVPGTFPMGAGGGSHTMSMPAIGSNPHGKLPPGHPSPNAEKKASPSTQQLP